MAGLLASELRSGSLRATRPAAVLGELVQFLATTHDTVLIICVIGTSSGRWWQRAGSPTHYAEGADGAAKAMAS